MAGAARSDGPGASGAKLRAKTALVACAPSDADNLFPVLPTAANDHVVVGQHDHPAGRLVDQGVMVLFEVAHHHAADDVVGVGDSGSAGGRHALGQRNTDRHAQGDGSATAPAMVRYFSVTG